MLSLIQHRKIILHRTAVMMLMISVCLLAACQSLPTVHALYNEDANLNAYATFSFHPQLNVVNDDYERLSTRYIKAAIVTQMQNKGYRYAQDSDLWVNFNTSTKEKLNVTSSPNYHLYYHFRRNYYGVWGDYPFAENRVTQYSEGTLNIDVVDKRTKTLLWEGIAIGKLNQETIDNLELKINEAVRLVFEKYPI